MNKGRPDGPGQRELERRERQERAKPEWQAGVHTGHEASVGSTRQATKRSKRSR